MSTEESESVSASFLIRVTLRPLNVGITITSGQWMSQTQTKDIGIISFIWGHYTHILHVIFVYFLQWKLKYPTANMLPRVLSEWEFSHQIYQPSSARQAERLGSVRISDISILWWTERARVLGAAETDRRDTLISYMDLGPTAHVWGRGWCSSLV